MNRIILVNLATKFQVPGRFVAVESVEDYFKFCPHLRAILGYSIYHFFLYDIAISSAYHSNSTKGDSIIKCIVQKSSKRVPGLRGRASVQSQSSH